MTERVKGLTDRRPYEKPTIDFLLSPDEAAKIANLSVRTMRRLMYSGQVKYIAQSPRRRGVLNSEIQRYIREGVEPI